MQKITLFAICFCSTCCLLAQRTPDDLVAVFFDAYKKDKSKAVKDLYDTSPWMSRATDAITNLVGEVEKLTPDYVGEFYGYS